MRCYNRSRPIPDSTAGTRVYALRLETGRRLRVNLSSALWLALTSQKAVWGQLRGRCGCGINLSFVRIADHPPGAGPVATSVVQAFPVKLRPAENIGKPWATDRVHLTSRSQYGHAH